MRRISERPLLSLIFGLWSAPGFSQGYENREVFWHDGWGWGHMFFGGLMMIAFWGGLILLVVLVVRWMASGPPSGRQTPLEILEERYARGDIDHDEFENRRKSLKR